MERKTETKISQFFPFKIFKYEVRAEDIIVAIGFSSPSNGSARRFWALSAGAAKKWIYTKIFTDNNWILIQMLLSRNFDSEEDERSCVEGTNAEMASPGPCIIQESRRAMIDERRLPKLFPQKILYAVLSPFIFNVLLSSCCFNLYLQIPPYGISMVPSVWNILHKDI